MEGCLRYQTRRWILELVITRKGVEGELLSRRGGVISDDACALPLLRFKYGTSTIEFNFSFPLEAYFFPDFTGISKYSEIPVQRSFVATKCTIHARRKYKTCTKYCQRHKPSFIYFIKELECKLWGLIFKIYLFQIFSKIYLFLYREIRY